MVVSVMGLGAIQAQSATAYTLSVSTRSDRASAVTLGGQSYSQSTLVYVFVQQASDIKSVKFYLDDPNRTGTPRQSEGLAPWDFAGTASDGTANGFSTGSLAGGSHTITAAISTASGTTAVVNGTFSVSSTSTLVFEDNFSGSAVNTAVWSPYDGPGHGGYGYRRPYALSVSNGMLVITGRMIDGKIVTGGMSHRSDYQYGRYEFRVRTDPDPTGTMSGIVMTWPKYQWSPEFTENDIYETGRAVSRRPFNSFVHYGYTYSTQKQFSHDADASQWHTMAMDWRASALKIYRDGVLVWTVTDKAVIPDVLHHVNIQLDARANNTLTSTVRMYVDYIRIYR